MEPICLCRVLLAKCFLWWPICLAWNTPFRCAESLRVCSWASRIRSCVHLIVRAKHDVWSSDSFPSSLMTNFSMLVLHKPIHSALSLVRLDTNRFFRILDCLLGEIIRSLPHNFLSLSVFSLSWWARLSNRSLSEKFYSFVALLIRSVMVVASHLVLPSLDSFSEFSIISSCVSAQGLNVSWIEFPLLELSWTSLVSFWVPLWWDLLSLILIGIIKVLSLVSFWGGCAVNWSLFNRTFSVRDRRFDDTILWRFELSYLWLSLICDFIWVVMKLFILPIWVILYPCRSQRFMRVPYFLLSSLSDCSYWHI